MRWAQRLRRAVAAIALLLLSGAVRPPATGASGNSSGPEEAAAGEAGLDSRERHLAGLTQLTAGGENAEAYWSPDGRELVFQSRRAPFECDQIFRMPADAPDEPRLVSTGRGRATCAFFAAAGGRIFYSSTHLAAAACPPPPDRSWGYVWPLYDGYEIFSAALTGSDRTRLTGNRAYDAETTVCPRDGTLLFTSTRDGDLELYRMDPDGGSPVRLTSAPGYDGGAVFSPDCSRIVWRASRPLGEELEDYHRLLGRGLVRPGRLELWVADADGGEARQVTYLGGASFAPAFFPDGQRIIFASNFGDPAGREFDLWAVDADGSRLERLTFTPGFDGFPMFSPDGGRLAFASNRRSAGLDGAAGETNIFVARWIEWEIRYQERGPDRFLADVRWLADDAREGRGPGTAGLGAAADYLEKRFRSLGLIPAGEDGYRHGFPVPTGIGVGSGTRVSLDGRILPPEEYVPASFSASGRAAGELVFAGYGITAPEARHDDYRGLDVRGKVVLARRFAPEAFSGDLERRTSDLRYKAWNAREHGAAGLLLADLPGRPARSTGSRWPLGSSRRREPEEEAPLPELAPGIAEGGADVGIPVVVLRRAAARRLARGRHRAELAIELDRRFSSSINLVGKLPAASAGLPGASPALPGAVVLGAHYDHLGRGSDGSLDPESGAVHNGADDNASGVAALLEVARLLAAHPEVLRRDVYFVAFAGEEIGSLGSSAFAREPPGDLEVEDLVAMLNFDMVGRMRDSRLWLLGTGSATEWADLAGPACRRAGLECSFGGDAYGPSDHSAFYAAGVPVLHLFTGIHADYHRPTDDAARINAAGGAQAAELAADLVAGLARRERRLTYRQTDPPPPAGDVRSHGASLGVLPDYAGAPGGRPGVLLAGVRAEGPAAMAGLRRGDLLVELAGQPVRDAHDLAYLLRKARPGERARAVVERGGERVEMTVTFGARPAHPR